MWSWRVLYLCFCLRDNFWQDFDFFLLVDFNAIRNREFLKSANWFVLVTTLISQMTQGKKCEFINFDIVRDLVKKMTLLVFKDWLVCVYESSIQAIFYVIIWICVDKRTIRLKLEEKYNISRLKAHGIYPTSFMSNI